MAQAAVIDKCDICGTEKDVKYYCIDCNEVPCSKCHFVHINGKRTKNDEIVLLQEARKTKLAMTPVIHCQEHTREEVTLWCNKCEELICTECLTGKHNTHSISKLKDIVELKTKEIMDVKKLLTDRKTVFQKAFDTEGKTHGDYIKLMEKLKTEITDQKSKIIEVLNTVCDRHFCEISSLLKKENERYTNVCTNIQEQNQALSSMLQSIDNAIDSKRPATIIQATKDGNQMIRHGPSQPSPSEVTTTRFLSDAVKEETVLQILGELHTKGAMPEQINITRAIKQEQINVSSVKIKSTIQVKGKTEGFRVIVPMDDVTMWVAAKSDKHLTLINNNGDVIKESISVPSDNGIDDAKKYNKELLVTYFRKQILKLSPDGRQKTVFADMSPYYSSGLCVTSELDVLVCVHSKYKKDKYGKVCRLGTTGEILQTIQYDQTGASLFDWTFNVTTLSTGEIVTTDWGDNWKIVCVNKYGHHLFTWSGEMDNGKTNKLGTMYITHDKFNNLFISDSAYNKVYALGKDGAQAKCLLDNTQGIEKPRDIVIHPATSNVLLGCEPGKILVIEY